MKKQILAIVGSASKESSNLKLVEHIASISMDSDVTIFNALHTLPHFDPALTDIHTPQEIVDIRNAIEKADGIIICTPEYIFSIPSGLKNLFEWCVSTTVFSQKPIALITASAQGEKCHEELKLIMKTVETIFTEETTLLIQGIKGKISDEGIIKDEGLVLELEQFIKEYHKLLF
ncbi:NADPH-dependent FMN reductase [uncultured Cytophaga sp.]|uniref:NADPH-dependent FMN reductase n=1 Tax=uncultured Cytophaga sp. TaxID=160238 RepID=UPI0026318968|nr:NADPH-dependent FMN reductase [uncultured Cytophaga sp.]